MTFACQLTVLRILAIPVFVWLAVSYGRSVAAGEPDEALRYWAIAVFVLASVTDALDGWVARRFDQRSRLGAVLDPLADKGLLLAAILTLTLSNWNYGLPLWFAVLVVARDLVILGGCLLLRHFNEPFEVRPSWAGKAATAAQMVAVAWVMLQIPHPAWAVWPAAIFTAASGAEYLARGTRLLSAHGGANAP